MYGFWLVLVLFTELLVPLLLLFLAGTCDLDLHSVESPMEGTCIL